MSKWLHPFTEFFSQVGYAESLPMADPDAYQEIFLNAIDEVLSTSRADTVLQDLGEQIQSLIPANGIKPIYVPEE